MTTVTSTEEEPQEIAARPAPPPTHTPAPTTAATIRPPSEHLGREVPDGVARRPREATVRLDSPTGLPETTEATTGKTPRFTRKQVAQEAMTRQPWRRKRPQTDVQGSGHDWLLSSPARDKNASHRGSVVVVEWVLMF